MSAPRLLGLLAISGIGLVVLWSAMSFVTATEGADGAARAGLAALFVRLALICVAGGVLAWGLWRVASRR